MNHPVKFQWLIAFALALVPTQIKADVPLTPLWIFDQTVKVVDENFYDKTFRGLPWKAMTEDARLNIRSNTSDEELQIRINQLLDQLRASHTEFLSNLDQEYWALESVFSDDVDGAPLKQIGAWFSTWGTN